MCFVHEVNKICVSWWQEWHGEVGLTILGEAWMGKAWHCPQAVGALWPGYLPEKFLSGNWFQGSGLDAFLEPCSAPSICALLISELGMVAPALQTPSDAAEYVYVASLPSLTFQSPTATWETDSIPLSPQAMITKVSQAWGLKWQKGLAQNSRARNLKLRYGRYWWGIFLSCALLPLHLFA